MTSEGARDQVGAALLLALILILPSGDGLQENLALFVGQSLVLGLAASRFATLSRTPFRWRATHADSLLALFLGICFVSLVRVDYTYAALVRLITLLVGVMLYALVREARLHRPEVGDTIRAALIVSSTASALHGIVLYFFEGGRARGFFKDPNGFAAFCNVGLALVLVRPIPGGNGRRNFASLAAAALMLAALVLSQSRGGLLAALLIVTIVLVREKRIRLLGMTLLLVAFAALLSPMGEKLLHPTRTEPFAWQRLAIYKMDIEMAASYPVTGIGLGQFPWYAAKFNFPVETLPVRYSKIALAAHSDPLRMFVELGAAGGFLFLCLQLYPVLLLLSTELSAIARAAATALIALGFHGLFHHLMLTDGLFLVWVLLLACLDPLGRAADIEVTGSRCWVVPGIAILVFFWISGVLLPYDAQREFDRAARSAGDMPAAQKALQKAIRLVPIQPYYYAAMADLYARYFEVTGNMQSFTRAVEEMEEASALNPNDWTFEWRLAALYSMAIGRGLRTEESLLSLRQALTRELAANPKSPVPLYHLAALDMREGNVGEAESHLREALRLEPNYLKAHHLLIDVFKQRNDVASAEREAAELRGLVRKFYAFSADENPQVREILSMTPEMKKEIIGR